MCFDVRQYALDSSGVQSDNTKKRCIDKQHAALAKERGVLLQALTTGTLGIRFGLTGATVFQRAAAI